MLDDGDRRLLSQFSLTTARFYALQHLGNQPGMSLSALSGLMLCDKSNATRIIKAMEVDGLVMRQPHETDRRTVRLYLTPKGDRLRVKTLANHRELNEQRFGNMNQIEHRILLDTLRHIRHELRDQLNPKGLV